MMSVGLCEKHFISLLTALLAVKNYPVQDAAALMPAFRAVGLLDPDQVAGMHFGSLVEVMDAAGYKRGKVVEIVAPRLIRLAEATKAGELDTLPRLAEQGDEAGFIAKLSSIYGFGPVTAKNAWGLWNRSEGPGR